MPAAIERCLQLTAFWGDTVLDQVTAPDDLVRSGFVPRPFDWPDEALDKLERRGVALLEDGPLVLRLEYVRAPILEVPPWKERANYAWLNSLMLAAFAHVFLVSALLMEPRTQGYGFGELRRNALSLTEVRFVAPPPSRRSQPGTLISSRRDGEAAAPEGRSGPRAPGRATPRGTNTPAPSRPSAGDALALLLGPEGSKVFSGEGGFDASFEQALGQVDGAVLHAAVGGSLGLSTRGDGPGGGGLRMSSGGLGRIGASWRGPGGDGDGPGPSAKIQKSDNEVELTMGSPIIVGALDKDQIRQVIDQHKAQIRYCYERALAEHPGLYGKLAMVWTIRADGSVDAVHAAENTLASSSVERCVNTKVRSWQFPKPRGGGVVVVNYPFVFKPAG